MALNIVIMVVLWCLSSTVKQSWPIVVKAAGLALNPRVVGPTQAGIPFETEASLPCLRQSKETLFMHCSIPIIIPYKLS